MQLRRLPAAAGVRMAILGSRKQSCSLPRVRAAAAGADGASALQRACRRACAKGACPHYAALGREEHARALHARCCAAEAAPYSLDDLAALAVGEAQAPGGCAYFSSLALVPNAEILFAPYAYVIDETIREKVRTLTLTLSLTLTRNPNP